MRGIMILLACLLYLASGQLSAQVKYVTDEFEIMMRRGTSSSHKIVRSLKSGAALTVLGSQDGYTRVRTANGVEGWVLSRFLINQPTGRQQYEALKRETAALKERFDQKVEEKTKKLQKRAKELEDLAKRPLELQRENANLKRELAEEKDRNIEIRKENEVLKSPFKDRQWFLSGAGIAIGSLLLGMLLTRIPWKKKRRWGEL